MYASFFALFMFSLVLIWIGISYREKTESLEFHMAGRKVGVLKLAASTFTLVGGGEFVTLTALSFYFGIYGIIFFIGAATGFVAIGYLVANARKYAVSDNLHSLPDFFAVHFGKSAALVSTVLASISLGALLLIQFVVGGSMLSIATKAPISVCIIWMAVVVCIYVYLGGFNGILTTDLIQALVMFVATLILVFAYSSPEGQVLQKIQQSSFPPFADVVSLVAGGFFAVFGGADVWQRILAGRDDKVTRQGLLVNAAGFILFGLFVVILALKIKSNHPDADPNSAFFLILETGLPGWLSAMLALLLFSSLISTADTELFVISTIINKQIGRSKSKADLTTKKTKLMVVIITILVCILSIVFQNLIDIYFLLLYFMMILGPITLARLIGRGSSAFCLMGLLGGASVLVLLIVFNKLTGWYPLLILLFPLLSFFKCAQKRNP